MQKKDQYGNLIPHQRKRGVFVFLSTIMLAGMFFISGNIKTTQAADSYTKLLLHADGTGNSFVDSSSGAKAINVSGDVTQSISQSKFGGKSVYFDGSGDYLSVANSSDFNFGSGDFTIDTWIYVASDAFSSASYKAISSSHNGLATEWWFGLNNSWKLRWYMNGEHLGSTSLSPSTWNHVAIVRLGTTSKIYLNGNVDVTWTDSNNYQTANPVWIGAQGNDSSTMFKGYMDEIRISKGIARWTANFTPPTMAYDSTNYSLAYTAGSNGTLTGTTSQTVAAGSAGTTVTAVPNAGYQFVNWNDGSTQNPRTDSSVFTNLNVTANFAVDAYTKLLLHGDGTGSSFVDSSPTPKTINISGSPTQSSTQAKFGGKSVYFDGTASYLSVPTSTDFEFTGDYTVDFWTYQTAYPPTSKGKVFMEYGPHQSGQQFFDIAVVETGQIAVSLYNGSAYVYSIANTLPLNAWTHIAAVRSGNNVYLFINGSLSASTTYTGSFAPTGKTLTIGYTTSNNGTNYPMSGYIDELRISKGIARWTSNFTPPTNAYGAATSFNLAYSAGANGSISGSSTQSVSPGGNGTAVTAVPNTGYHFVNWSDSSTSNPRTDSNVQANISVTANFAINSYTLSYSAGTGGTLSGSDSQNVNYGASGTAVTANPASGYHFVNWSDGSTQNPRTDANVSSNLNLTANFSNALTLTYSAGANGTISGTTPQSVSPNGNSTAVTAVPATGYHFVNWSDDSTQNPRTETNVTNNITVTANFSINTYTLDYAAGAHGTLSGMTSQTVNYNANGTAVTASPDTNYFFINWSDGSTQNPRTDINVVAGKSVTAIFSNDQYTKLLLHGDGTNGSTAFSDSSLLSKVVIAGGNAQISTAQSKFGGASMYFDGSGDYLSTPALGLKSTDFTVDGFVRFDVISSQVIATSYNLPGGAQSNTFIMALNSDGNIWVGNGLSGYGIGSTSVLAPNTWYHVAVTYTGSSNMLRIFVNGELESSIYSPIGYEASSFYIGGSPGDNNIGSQWMDGYIDEFRVSKGIARWTSNFTPPTSAYDLMNFGYTLAYVAGSNGTLSGTTSQTVSSGGNGTAITAIPSTGYHFVNWSDNSTDNPRTDTNVQGPVTVAANFAINSYTLVYSANPHGSISGTTSQTINYGQNGSQVTATPSPNYHFTQWSDGGLTATRTESDVTSNKSFTASFALNDQVIDNPTPQKITDVYNLGAFTLTDGTSTSTSKATTTTNLTLTSNNTTLEIPSNTQITKTDSGNLNLTNLTTSNITQSIQATVGTSKAAVKIGIPNIPITFSQDVTINLSVPSSYSNETLTIYSRPDGGNTWTYETTCHVTDATCTFTTRHATEFTANFEVSNSPDPTHVNMDINSTITIDCKDKNTNTNDYIAMNPITGTGKSTPNANNDVNCNVITNNSNGYSLSFTSSTPELISTTDSNDKVNPYTPGTTNTPETWNVPTANSEWGARLLSTSSTYDPTTWGTIGTDDYTTKWYAVTNSNNFILANRGTETAQTGDDQIIRFGAEIGANKFQPTGTYTDNVTFTVVTN